MTIEDIIDLVRAMDAVVVLQPQPGDGSPEVAWGDVFFYYSPDGVVPKTQPFATIVTKDYPGDSASRLDRPGAFRLNIAAGPAHTGSTSPEARDDTVITHPVYGRQGWLAIANPGRHTAAVAQDLLRSAHRRAHDQFTRRKKNP
ncbi:DUF6194 family protein [Mycobacterium sp. 21AC1]|uniref:DUF6194 family protein n=1 Tax=[Mycobacterium] appelbergii TaxID=2939269 RepID=UPI002938F309|nr:DUF6194 family protein [Mycobacterium sp. 21AC1]MDV3125315.1 DUF6194 family protein [Mycobacterium sp. 21AC1]